MKKFVPLFFVLIALFSFFLMPANAAEYQVDMDSVFCFQANDFSAADADDGIFLTSLPKSSVAQVRYGNRTLRAGDALTKEMLDQLTLTSTCVNSHTATIGYCTVSGGSVTGVRQLKFSILPKKNESPVAEDSAFETYRNIAHSAVLPATDPDGDNLTYEITKDPKRGTVELQEDGTYTYTPNDNKVGKDSFQFRVTDEAGKTSEPATVSIMILKPTEKRTYADMTEDPDHFYAVWMQENGLFTGEVIADHLCFDPEHPVSRGEFLVMAMKLVQADTRDTSLTSGFADENDTPAWMQPYIATALTNGMISGVQSDSGLMFRPDADMTRAEAAVILQNILQLPNKETQSVFSAEDASAIPTWAIESVAALNNSGITLSAGSIGDALSRRDAAKIFYKVDQLIKTEITETFYWVQKQNH